MKLVYLVDIDVCVPCVEGSCDDDDIDCVCDVGVEGNGCDCDCDCDCDCVAGGEGGRSCLCGWELFCVESGSENEDEDEEVGVVAVKVNEKVGCWTVVFAFVCRCGVGVDGLLDNATG